MATKSEQYIDNLTANGKISFTTKEFCHELAITHSAGLSALERLKKKNNIASPSKGYYLILTPEFRSRGCLPPDFFIDDLMQHLNLKYYVSLLSASMFYGAAHQQPQILQVMLEGKRENIRCGNCYIEFIKNNQLPKSPIQKIKTRTGYMNVSTPETTAMDMMKFMRQSGGLNRIATVIEELVESITKENLCDLVKQSKEYSWAHRLGFLLDKLGYDMLSSAIYESLNKKPKDMIPLVPYTSITGVPRNKKWRIAINMDIESDLNDT